MEKHVNFDSKGNLQVSNVSVKSLTEKYGTPLYVYSREVLTSCLKLFPVNRADVTVCYSVAANSNLTILELICRNGCFFEITSKEELRRVYAAGKAEALRESIVTGYSKSIALLRVSLKYSVHAILAESKAELRLIAGLRSHKYPKSKTQIGIRLKLTDEDCEWGVSPSELASITAKHRVEIVICDLGLAIDHETFRGKARRLLATLNDLEESERKPKFVTIQDPLRNFCVGGYDGGDVLDEVLKQLVDGGYKTSVIVGGALVAACGVLLTTVEYTTTNQSGEAAIVDASTDIVSLSDSHEVLLDNGQGPAIGPATPPKPMPSPRLSKRGITVNDADPAGQFENLMEELNKNKMFRNQNPVPKPRAKKNGSGLISYSIYGSSSGLNPQALVRQLPKLKESNVLAILNVGAYCFSMSGNFRSLNRGAQVLIGPDKKVELIGRRELLEDQLMLETKLESFQAD